MMMRDWLMLPMFVCSMAAGCGADCAALCEDAKKCDDADQEIDCEKACEDNEKKSEAAGCESQYEERLSCTDDLGDVCKQGEVCEPEQRALDKCME
jgi:hypothetical protein